MGKITVSLVGKQTQPNILLIKELAHHDPQNFKHVLIYSTDTEKQIGFIKKTCSEFQEAQFIDILVQEDDIKGIQNELDKKLSVEDEDEIFVNITGGTKVMSLACYDYFQKLNAKILYQNIRRLSEYQIIQPLQKNKFVKYSYSLNLKEYLNGYGIQIQNPNKLHELTQAKEFTLELFDHSASFSGDDWRAINLIRKFRDKNMNLAEEGKHLQSEELEFVSTFLSKIKFAQKESLKLSKAETKYLSGDWFEEYVYVRLKTLADFKDDFWGMGIQISIDNELDILFMNHNVLNMIECKTRMVSEGGHNILTETIYKSDSLKSKFGLQVPTFLVSLDRKEDLEKGIKRSEAAGIKIINRDILESDVELKNILKLK